MDEKREITVRAYRQGMVLWRDLQWFQGGLKEMTTDGFERLKRSLLDNGFSDPFKLWEDEGGQTWILDGHHRQRAMEDLIQHGHEVPEELPAVWVHARDKAEAARLVLAFSSIYARVTEEGLYEFQNEMSLDFDSVKLNVDIPGLDLEHYEAGYLMDPDIDIADDDALHGSSNQRGTYRDGLKIQLGLFTKLIRADHELYERLLALSDRLLNSENIDADLEAVCSVFDSSES